MEHLNQERVEHKKDTLFLLIIGILSVLIPIVVAILIFMPKEGINNLSYSFIPHLNAIFNSATAICLILGYYFIKNNKKSMHRTMMLSAFVLSSLFLVFYIIYHFNVPSTKYLGTSFLKYIYYFLLLTHILLSISIVYFALRSIYFGLTHQYDKHRRISKWTLPIWIYVAISGVIVYLMISPYYLHQ